jgi:hypothetical protein
MDGFHEKGEPEAWDMAVGTVRGYRWWQLRLPFVRSSSLLGRYTTTTRDIPWPMSEWTPSFTNIAVAGMHGGCWSQYSRKPDGWHKAVCERYGFTTSLLPQSCHPAPEPSCGCGFWAYWSDQGDYRTHPCVTFQRAHGYIASIPLFGVIEGSGRTIIGEKGFRTQRAKVTDITVAGTELPCYYEDQDHSVGEFINLNSITDPVSIAFSGPQQMQMEIISFLAQTFMVSSEVVRNAFDSAVTEVLGADVRVHASMGNLYYACPPDENYG